MKTVRPYVVPTLKDGVLTLLDDESHEFKLAPRDAAELAVQILRAYCQTFPFGVEIQVPPEGPGHVPDPIVALIDAPTLRLGSVTGAGFGVLATLKPKPYQRPEFYVYEAMKAQVLRDVRRALGFSGAHVDKVD